MSDKLIVRFDAHLLNTIESCMYKTKLSIIDRWVPPIKDESLSKGLLVHDGMKVYYTAIMNGSTRKDAMDAMITSIRKRSTTSDLSIPLCEEVVAALLEYGIFYIDDDWVPLAIEQPFSYVLYEDDNLIILHEGVVDLIMASSKIKMAVVDHKSSKRNSTILSLSNQFKSYSKAFATHYVIINKIGFQKTLPPAQKFVRQLISYNNEIIDAWVAKAIRRIKQYIRDREQNNFEMNETACDKYRGCIFRFVCDMPKSSHESLLIDKYRVGPEWDPFHREEEDVE